MSFMKNKVKRKNNVFLLFLFFFVFLCFLVVKKSEVFDFLVKPTNKIKYYCEDGYNLKNSKCIKIVDTKDPIINYYCNKGYDLDGTNCIRYEYDEVQVKWYCRSGYKTGHADYPDLCYKDILEAYTISYYCDYGYTLNGSKCTKQKSVSPSSNNFVCPGGSNYIYAYGVCVLTGVFTSCPGGYSVLERNGRYVTCFRYPSTVKFCPEGTTANGSKCDYPTEIIDAHSYKTCRYNARYDKKLDQCVYTDYEVPDYQTYCNGDFEYHDGYCYKVYSESANYTSSCDDDYILENDKCVKYEITDMKISEN